MRVKKLKENGEGYGKKGEWEEVSGTSVCRVSLLFEEVNGCKVAPVLVMGFVRETKNNIY